jgi:hypothetical protein
MYTLIWILSKIAVYVGFSPISHLEVKGSTLAEYQFGQILLWLNFTLVKYNSGQISLQPNITLVKYNFC